MKKPLQEQERLFFYSRNGQFYVGGSAEVWFLTECANKFLGHSLEREAHVSKEHLLSLSLQAWMNRLIDEGVTEKMINELNEALNEIRFQHLLMPSKTGSPSWEHVANMNSEDPDDVAAYRFSQHLADGSLNGLKRCQVKGCKRFFIGRPNAKWCSKKCGSRFRVRQKRKRDRD